MACILHVITGLGNGGAEAVLYRLVTHDTMNTHVVISLTDMGIYGERLVFAGVSVYPLDMPRGRITFHGMRRLYRILREVKPDLVQTWMYHSDLVGGVVARIAGIQKIVWGLRHSNLEPGKTARATRWVANLCAWLSNYIPSKIVSCAEKAMRVHIALGYSRDKMIVIPNGIEMDEFSPCAKARARIRQEWGISNDEVLIGMIARWHPEKDHANLIAALAALSLPSATLWRAVLIGPNIDRSNEALISLLQEYDLLGQVCLMGVRSDIPSVMNALDLHVLSSSGEGFPNVVTEALACGTPSVVTDVGDAGRIVGDTGWIVPPSDAIALSNAIQRAILSMSDKEAWTKRKTDCRQRVVEHFSVEQMVDAYKLVWQSVIFDSGSD